jgi:hypothetical protein
LVPTYAGQDTVPQSGDKTRYWFESTPKNIRTRWRFALVVHLDDIEALLYLLPFGIDDLPSVASEATVCVDIGSDLDLCSGKPSGEAPYPFQDRMTSDEAAVGFDQLTVLGQRGLEE